MLIAEDLLLLATDDVSGKLLRSSSYVDVALGGALLVELVLADRVHLDGAGWRARAVVIDNRPLADPTLNAALARLAEKPPARPTAVVNRLAKGARKALYAGMGARGIVTAVEHQVLGIFPNVRWPATNLRYEDQLRLVLGEILLGVRQPTPHRRCIGVDLGRREHAQGGCSGRSVQGGESASESAVARKLGERGSAAVDRGDAGSHHCGAHRNDCRVDILGIVTGAILHDVALSTAVTGLSP